MRWVIFGIFAVTYAALSARRLHLLPIGRPSLALVGAAAAVVVGRWAGPHGLPPDDALAAVDPGTVALLLGTMLVSASLALAGFFDRAAAFIASIARSPAALLHAITLGAGLLSALLVNDAVCLLAAPLVARLARDTGAPRVPLLLGLAMGANAGSAMTLAGNPQNMLVARLSGLTYRDYLASAGPAGLAALVVTSSLLHLAFRRELADASAHAAPRDAPPITIEPSAAAPDRTLLLRVALLTVVGVAAANLAGAHLAFTALTGAAVVLVAARDEAPALFPRVDWTTLVFFSGLFVLVAALRRTGLPDEALGAVARLTPPSPTSAAAALCATLMLGSQIVSNVPLILLLEPSIRALPDPALAWSLTALVSTLAGNLTLLGSVANVIVIEQAGAQHEIGFWQHARVGAPITLVATLVGVVVMMALR